MPKSSGWQARCRRCSTQGDAAAQEAAHRAIEETQVIRLSVEDQRAFADAILNPPAPTPALRRAFRRHRELIPKSR
jgi:uncharacterized protein (DUF1778 family)